MKDFLGSFGEGAAKFARGFLFPAVVAVALWSYFVLDIARTDESSMYAEISNVDGSDVVLVFSAAALALALLLGVITPTVTRLLEGYWWGRQHDRGPAQWLWDRRVSAHHKRRKKLIQEINRLISQATRPSRRQRAALSRCWSQLRRYPTFPEPTMPTKLGNVLRAGEKFGSDRYGLDAITMWDTLLAGVPDSLVETHSNRRMHMDLFISTTALPVLFVLGTVHATATTPVSAARLGVIFLVGVAVSVASYGAAVEVAKNYADSIAAIVQLGRRPLAKALGLALPQMLADEQELWRAVSGFMFWGEKTSRNEGWVSTIEKASAGPPESSPE